MTVLNNAAKLTKTFSLSRVCFVTFWNNVLFAFSTFIRDASSGLTHLNTLLNYSACIFPSNLADFSTFYDRICCLEYNELETWKNVLTRVSTFFHWRLQIIICWTEIQFKLKLTVPNWIWTEINNYFLNWNNTESGSEVFSCTCGRAHMSLCTCYIIHVTRSGISRFPTRACQRSGKRSGVGRKSNERERSGERAKSAAQIPLKRNSSLIW